MEDGSMLVGEDAPKKKHLEQWLLEHPGFMVSGSVAASAAALPFVLNMQDDQPPPSPVLNVPDLPTVSEVLI